MHSSSWVKLDSSRLSPIFDTGLLLSQLQPHHATC